MSSVPKGAVYMTALLFHSADCQKHLLRREQMSLVIWPGSLSCCIPTLTPRFLLQPTTNLFAVTKHHLSRGWFYWEALPDMRGAVTRLTLTHYCRLIRGLSTHVTLYSSLLAWSAGIRKYDNVLAEASNSKSICRIRCCFTQTHLCNLT